MSQPPPSLIPVPSSPSPALASPSAFPSLNGDSSPTPASPVPAQQPTGIPSFAALAKKSLPPSKAPEGISVPASALTRQDTKERLQPSQNGKDSPYARPPNGTGGANGAAGIRGKKKSLTGAARGGAVGAGGRVKTVSGNAKAAHASQSSAEESATEKKADRPRTVPGMPASMLPPPPKKKSHGRAKSDAGLAVPPSSSSSAGNPSGAANTAETPALGKKRRASLRKVLPPNTSKLSALAPSFDFVPRSATTPNLSSYASSSTDDSALSTDEASPPSPSVDRKTESHTSGALTPSFKELSLEAQGEVAPGEKINAEEPSSVPSPAAPSSPTVPAANTSNASHPLTAQEEQDIKETVASAGAQGDEFRSKTFEQADEEGVKEVEGATSAGEQSASSDKPTALSSAPEEEQKVKLVEAVAEPEPERTDRSLAAFLPSAFTPAASRSASGTATPSGVAFAPLVLPEEEGEEKAEQSKQEPEKEKEKEATTIPGPVHQSPLAPFAYEKKEGWWSPSYVPQYAGPLRLDASTSSSSAAREEATIPAAVEPAQAETSQVLYKLPAWQPPKEEGKDERTAKEVAATEAPDAASKIASFLPTAFSERVDIPTSAEAVAATASLPSVTSHSTAAPSPAAPEPSTLSSYLSSSFAPLASTGFAPLEEIQAEALANGKGETDFPLSAEEVAAQPSLNEELEEAAEVAEGEGAPAKKQEKEEKKGWWSPGFDPSNPPISADEQSKAAATVQSAGAQADGFVSKGFTEADSQGAKEVEGKKAGEQSATPTAFPEAEQKKGEKSSTPSSDSTETPAPLGSFLSSAFSTTSPPSSSSFPPVSPTSDIPSSIPPPAALTSGTIRSAGAQGDAFVAQSYTAADRVGVVEEHKVPESEAHGTNPLGQYLTRHFVEEAKDEGEESGKNTVTSTQAAAASPSSTTALAPAASTSTSTSSSVPAKRSADSHDDAEDDDQKKRRTNTSSSSQPSSGDKDAPSLTLALTTAWTTAPWTRKLWAVIASLGINVGLPFINGVMLGFGELFARNVLGVRLGWPLHSSSPTVPATTTGRANTAGVGLRSAGSASGSGPRIGTEVPGNAGAKTAVEAVVEGAAQQ